MTSVTFTYPDSMYEFAVDENGKIIKAGRTNTPEVFLYNELESSLMNKYKENGVVIIEDHYIEAQVWNREMIYKYLRNFRSKNQHITNC
jgi:hypothetical protein